MNGEMAHESGQFGRPTRCDVADVVVGHDALCETELGREHPTLGAGGRARVDGEGGHRGHGTVDRRGQEGCIPRRQPRIDLIAWRDGVRHLVVDAGTARILRYSHRLKVQRLPIEAVSQASANQRAGRCGRTSDGICIRLYGEDDFQSRPEFTDPEILRTNLASVILRMAALDLGDVATFPFVEAPDQRSVRDGVALLRELGAFTPDAARERLTPLGTRLAQLPLDPRLGRMVLEAERAGCLREVLVIAAALTIVDPRERPL